MIGSDGTELVSLVGVVSNADVLSGGTIIPLSRRVSLSAVMQSGGVLVASTGGKQRGNLVEDGAREQIESGRIDDRFGRCGDNFIWCVGECGNDWRRSRAGRLRDRDFDVDRRSAAPAIVAASHLVAIALALALPRPSGAAQNHRCCTR